MKRSKPILSLLTAAGLAWSAGAGATVVFDGRFASGDFQNYLFLEADGISGRGTAYPNGIPDHLSVVADPADPTRLVMAATRLAGDLPVNGGYRSEISAPGDPQGAERWYSWGLYFPASWDADDNLVTVAQIHDTADANESAHRAATLTVDVQNGVVSIVNSYDYDRQTGQPNLATLPGLDYTRRVLASWPLETGQWVYFDLHARWAGDDTGLLEIWKDDALIFAEADHINTYNDAGGVWFKAGAYVSPSTQWNALTTLFSGVRIADGADSPRGGNQVEEPSGIALMSLGMAILLGGSRRRRFPTAQPANSGDKSSSTWSIAAIPFLGNSTWRHVWRRFN